MNLLQKIKNGANKATEKAQHAVEIQKMNSQIGSIQQEMDVHFLKMGQIFYEGYRLRDMSVAEAEMTQLSKACDELQDEIDSIRSRIAELKNERLCECGASVPRDANFCPKCGRKLVDETAFREVAVAREQAPQFTDTAVFSYADKPVEPPIEKKPFETPELDEDDFGDPNFSPEEKAEFDAEWERRRREELERERQHELDERIRYWKTNNQDEEVEPVETNSARGLVKCQICTAELPKGSKWCPRCGAEQI
ncbi:zinc ribbon domain-containing protein [Paenibacillus sp. P96]|uniref:Zinc ribbon domain-containing protein n=1 Tax=Paenibacillus zeirhizosphaerae TaxID=2987519 RepID=A0ABT9FUZ3_9BACL|nr:zinc ribbon domain-containing protein [Paenibacillus sp. P96]MDP4098557.1 zinc ribbon domain-containing protein [Paenibacillus sp. P96]